jgi:hypothetical protein
MCGTNRIAEELTAALQARLYGMSSFAKGFIIIYTEVCSGRWPVRRQPMSSIRRPDARYLRLAGASPSSGQPSRGKRCDVAEFGGPPGAQRRLNIAGPFASPA